MATGEYVPVNELLEERQKLRAELAQLRHSNNVLRAAVETERSKKSDGVTTRDLLAVATLFSRPHLLPREVWAWADVLMDARDKVTE